MDLIKNIQGQNTKYAKMDLSVSDLLKTWSELLIIFNNSLQGLQMCNYIVIQIECEIVFKISLRLGHLKIFEDV